MSNRNTDSKFQVKPQPDHLPARNLGPNNLKPEASRSSDDSTILGEETPHVHPQAQAHHTGCVVRTWQRACSLIT